MANPAQELGKLKPYFATGGRLELRGCHTGAGADAEKLMDDLADLLNIEVHASPMPQPMTGLDWVGVVYVARPGRPPLKATSGVSIK